MTKKYLLDKIEHHIKLSYACYEARCYRIMFSHYFKACAYYEMLCEFYTVNKRFPLFSTVVTEVLGEKAGAFVIAFSCLEVVE